ncbi:hypothetical protein [Nocardia sp. SSK8]|uniref:hypothetical protein n=1 Tax=Nocardia sp. SSK8 TaxID=3120154 RepID=UPI003009D480
MWPSSSTARSTASANSGETSTPSFFYREPEDIAQFGGQVDLDTGQCQVRFGLADVVPATGLDDAIIAVEVETLAIQHAAERFVFAQ